MTTGNTIDHTQEEISLLRGIRDRLDTATIINTSGWRFIQLTLTDTQATLLLAMIGDRLTQLEGS